MRRGYETKSLGFWDRWLFPLLPVDTGAKCGVIEPDEVTERFVAQVDACLSRREDT